MKTEIVYFLAPYQKTLFKVSFQTWYAAIFRWFGLVGAFTWFSIIYFDICPRECIDAFKIATENPDGGWIGHRCKHAWPAASNFILCKHLISFSWQLMRLEWDQCLIERSSRVLEPCFLKFMHDCVKHWQLFFFHWLFCRNWNPLAILLCNCSQNDPVRCYHLKNSNE